MKLQKTQLKKMNRLLVYRHQFLKEKQNMKIQNGGKKYFTLGHLMLLMHQKKES